MANYTITGQHQTAILDPAGRFVDVMEVLFSIPTVGTGKVEVPIAEYTATRVGQLVQERVDHMVAVHQLGNGGMS